MHMVFILLQPVPSKLGTGVFKSPTQLSLQFMHIQMKCQKLYNQTKFTDSSSLVSAAFCICQGRSCSARRMRRRWKTFLAMKGYGTFMFACFSQLPSQNKQKQTAVPVEFGDTRLPSSAIIFMESCILQST